MMNWKWKGKQKMQDAKAQLIGRVEARQLVDQIRAGLDDVRDAVIALWQGTGWLALGYPTWDDLCDAELRMRVQLPREERREVVAQLTDAGMSTRAIGSALGVGVGTVHRDQEATVPNGTDERPKVISLDGRVRSRPAPPPPPPREDPEVRRERERQQAEELSVRMTNVDVAGAVYTLAGFTLRHTDVRFLQERLPRHAEFVEAGIRLTPERIAAAISFLTRLSEELDE
jgi:hypothetical protein